MITPSVAENGSRAAWPLSSALPPLGALPTAPGSARAYVRDVLAGWQLGGMSDLCEIVVSELATNALNASTGPTGALVYVNGRMPVIRVCLMSDGSQVLIECHDEAAGTPSVRDADPETAESGRGLNMIDALTGGRWGWHLKKGRHGKCVWAVLTPDREPDSQARPHAPEHRTERQRHDHHAR